MRATMASAEAAFSMSMSSMSSSPMLSRSAPASAAATAALGSIPFALASALACRIFSRTSCTAWRRARARTFCLRRFSASHRLRTSLLPAKPGKQPPPAASFSSWSASHACSSRCSARPAVTSCGRGPHTSWPSRLRDLYATSCRTLTFSRSASTSQGQSGKATAASTSATGPYGPENSLKTRTSSARSRSNLTRVMSGMACRRERRLAAASSGWFTSTMAPPRTRQSGLR
mmetsp:Transcript_8160/g.32150  ORF Transcript_8160/g.32150 Transcript_8160/m.32150 type:complete len:231 (+) Transcript_8160:416-1108(+)